MSIGITEDHRSLQQSVQGWAERAGLRAAARAVAEGETDASPWSAVADQGLLGLAIDEEHGGSGASVVELAIAVEELGRTLGPLSFLPTVLTSLIVARLAPPDVAKVWLPRLVDGSTRAAIELSPGAGALGAANADLVLVAEPDGWSLVESSGLEIAPGPKVDPTRAVDAVRVRPGAERIPLTGVTAQQV